MEMTNLYIVGTAGSGKTALASAFQHWVRNRGFEVVMVNLDPGAEQLPYQPDIDIRDWVKLEEVMDKYSLGPNGAQILCADLIALNVQEIKTELNGFEAPYAVIDTPGQIELFAFRPAFKIFINALGKRSFLAFLLDPLLARSPEGFISLLLLSASTQFRFGFPYLNILSKVDLLDQKEVEKIVNWSLDFESLYEALRAYSPSMAKESSLEFFKALEGLHAYTSKIAPISSITLFGIEELYNAIQQIYMGGEDLV
ncbi:MAG: ATP/GTP-binding protein [Halobacteria archaeon]